MPINLTANFAIPNATRLVADKPVTDDDNEVMRVPLELRSAAATNALVTRVILEITNIESTKVARQAAPAVGLNIEDRDRYFLITRRPTPTGFTDAINAWRAGATSAARKAALEAHLLAAGHIDATLTGT